MEALQTSKILESNTERIIRDKIIEATKKEAFTLFNSIEATYNGVKRDITKCTEKYNLINKEVDIINARAELIKKGIKKYEEYMDICKQLDKENQKQYNDWTNSVQTQF